MAEPPVVLRVFVYGSLKRGERNHQAFCRGFVSAEPATILGRMYQQPSGYPMLVVPESQILLHGSADYADDARRGLDVSLDDRQAEPDPAAGDPWQAIEGEVMAFGDPASRLPLLDRLEDFRPGATDSLYHRVVYPVRLLESDAVVPSWVYIAPAGRLPAGSLRIGCVWTEQR